MLQRQSNTCPDTRPDGKNDALAAHGLVKYEDRLSQDKGWGLNEAGKIFEGRSEVQKTMRRIAEPLTALGIVSTFH